MREVSSSGDPRLSPLRSIASVCAIAAAGCDVVFDFEEITSFDAGVDAACGVPDEDDDCFADADDNCPGIANPSQSNDLEGTTPDELGDVCDPEPALPRNRVALMEGFPLGSIANWRLEPGSAFTFRDGFVEHAEQSDTVGQLKSLSGYDEPALGVEVGFTFHAWAPNAAAPRIGVFLDAQEIGTDGNHCFVTHEVGFPAMTLAFQQENGSNNARSALFPSLVEGDQVVISFHRTRDAGRLRCRVTVNGQGTDLPELPRSALGIYRMPAYIAAESREIVADIHYLAIYVGSP